MAFRYLGLLTLLLLQSRSNASVIPFNGEVNINDVGVEDLKELLLTSMQNTLSLNTLVTQLTQKIVDIMLKLGDTETKMEQMRETLSTEIAGLKNEIAIINATTDTDIENVKEALAGVKNNVSTGIEKMGQTLSTEIDELKNEIKIEQATTDRDIVKVIETLAGVKNNVSTRMEQMRDTHSTEIDGLKNEIASINATTVTDIVNVKEALAGVKNNVSKGIERMGHILSTEIEGLNNEMRTIKTEQATTDTDIENVKEALAGVNNNVSVGIKKMEQTLSTEIAGLKNEINIEQETTDTDIENVKEGLVGVEKNVESLGSGIQELREQLQEVQMSREVTIISSEEAPGNSQCAKICAGTTGRTTTNWTDYSTDGIKTHVNMSGCGFASVPTITASMEGRTSHWTATGMSSVYSATANGFYIYINDVVGAQGGKASSSSSVYMYNIEWVAVGYTC